MFTTHEEIQNYFEGEKIRCLECGKLLKELGWHLKKIHEMSCDQYKKKYGLPWSRGLVSEELHERRSEKAKRLVAEGKIAQHFSVDLFQNKKKEKAAVHKQRVQPFLRKIVSDMGKKHIHANRCLCPPGMKKSLTHNDFDLYIKKLTNTNKSINAVYIDGGVPHPNTLYAYAKKNKVFADKLKSVSNYNGPVVKK